MPRRFLHVHDCERPRKWRQTHSDEECEIYELESAAKRHASHEEPRTARYGDVVPHLATMEAFLQANGRAAERERVVVVLFYARDCAENLRIAARYRRLALRYGEEVDCYEAEQSAARPLLDELVVARVPSIQIFDGSGASRLARFDGLGPDRAHFRAAQLKAVSYTHLTLPTILLV